YGPTVFEQSQIRIGIPESIHLDFLPPELRVLLRPGGMFGAPVPEAPIDEDGDLQPWKCHVCYTARFLQNLIVDSVAQTRPIQLFPLRKFDISPRLPNPRHAAASRGRRRPNAPHQRPLISSSSRDRGNVGVNATRDGATEIDGDRISDKPSQNLKTHFPVFRHKCIVPWKALKNCCFSQ